MWKEYRKKVIATTEMRPYVPGEDLTGISVSIADDPPEEGDMIARNPKNSADMWLVGKEYFNDNYEEVV